MNGVSVNCNSAILSALDAAAGLSSFKVILPPSDGIGKVWPESQHLVALPQGSQVVIASLPQAHLIALALLEVVVSEEQAGSSSQSFQGTSHNVIPWALDACSSLWQHFSRIKNSPTMAGSRDTIETLYLQLLDVCCLPAEMPGSVSPQCARNVEFFSTSLSKYILSSCDSTPSESVQIQLASVLMRLMGTLMATGGSIPGESGSCARLKDTVADDLEPTITQTCRSSALASLERDLQVSAWSQVAGTPC